MIERIDPPAPSRIFKDCEECGDAVCVEFRGVECVEYDMIFRGERRIFCSEECMEAFIEIEEEE